MTKDNFLKWVALGILSVLLVYFITVAVTSYAKQLADNRIPQANFEVTKNAEAENDIVGSVYMTLNWNEFSNHVVFQVGNQAGYTTSIINASPILKDNKYWFYIYEKNNNGSLDFVGSFSRGMKSGIFWKWDEVLKFNEHNPDDLKNDLSYAMLCHEFTNYYTDDIWTIENEVVNAKYGAGVFAKVKDGDQPYLTKNADKYIPAPTKDSYKISLHMVDKYIHQLINEVYMVDISSDIMLGINEEKFLCYSEYHKNLGKETEDGYVRFDLRMFIDYKDYTLKQFNFDSLGTMYDLVKTYDYYNGL